MMQLDSLLEAYHTDWNKARMEENTFCLIFHYHFFQKATVSKAR